MMPANASDSSVAAVARLTSAESTTWPAPGPRSSSFGRERRGGRAEQRREGLRPRAAGCVIWKSSATTCLVGTDRASSWPLRS